MRYAEILVQAATDAGAARRLKIAVDLATRFEAKLVGVFLEPAPPALFAPGFELALSEPQATEILAQHRAVTETQAGRARAAFETEAIAGLRTDWRALDGGAPESLVGAARASDLLVMPDASENAGGGVFAPPDAIALGSGAPVIVVPQIGSTTQVGRRVLVAWNGSREAARAIRDALPLLKSAGTVVGVIVGHPPDARDGEAVLEGYFDRHGCVGSVIRLPKGEEPVGDILLRHVARIDADLLVMGLYGHSRFREFILGGASQDLLKHSSVPLFLVH